MALRCCVRRLSRISTLLCFCLFFLQWSIAVWDDFVMHHCRWSYSVFSLCNGPLLFSEILSLPLILLSLFSTQWSFVVVWDDFIFHHCLLSQTFLESVALRGCVRRLNLISLPLVWVWSLFNGPLLLSEIFHHCHLSYSQLSLFSTQWCFVVVWDNFIFRHYPLSCSVFSPFSDSWLLSETT